MRRLPGILLTSVATIVVIVALAISGLRLALPQLDRIKQPLVDKIQSMTGVPVSLSQIHGSWQTFGPTLEVRDLAITLPDSSSKVERVTLALDVWQSLLHLRWQFRNLTFYNLRLDLNSTLGGGDDKGKGIGANRISDIFLRQVDHFDLRNSRVSFLTPSGPRAEFDIQQMTWLNSPNRHRAEGQLGLSSFNGQHGVVQVRMDLNDDDGLLNDGKIYLQADNIDMKPWFSRWLRSNTGLESANFSLAAWLTVRDGQVFAGDVHVREGEAVWHNDDQPHRLDVDNLTLHGNRQGNGWQVGTPELNLKTDGEAWPKGGLTALYLPENGTTANTQFLGPDQQEQLRLRGSNIQLERIGPLIPTISFMTPALLERWQDLKPSGTIDTLALDIPLKQPEQTRFNLKWHNLRWARWELLPGVNNFSGSLSGSVPRGQIKIDLQDSLLPFGEMFRSPLDISQASGTFDWTFDDKGWSLWSQNVDVKAKGLWATGGFSYEQPAKGQPLLKILSGIRLYDAGQAWRYFPEPLMGKHLVNYLSGAIQAGQVDNATLSFNGNPHDFPFKHNEGQFQVWVPLRHSTFEFQPGWPALTDLDIDLDFLNDGLFMKAAHTRLGNVSGNNVVANIPDYLKQKLLIDADIQGAGKEIGSYFMQTPLKGSLGAALQQLQIGGDVSGRLHLDIPLNGEQVRATGGVNLKNNSLFIKPLESKIENLDGQFSFDNGNLDSNRMTAKWFGQPVNIRFKTLELTDNYGINVDLDGNWQPAKLPGLPKAIAEKISGSANWKSNVDIMLPHKGTPNYKVTANADLRNVSSHLPNPLNKTVGRALPLAVNVQGDLNSFTLNGVLAGKDRFNSRWLLGKQLTLDRAAWEVNAAKTPALPETSSLTLHLPALDGENWLGLLSPDKATQTQNSKTVGFGFPHQITVTTPRLTLAGQGWNDLTLSSTQNAKGTQIKAKGQEIDGTLDMNDRGPWLASLRYLYFNPQWTSLDKSEAGSTSGQNPFGSSEISFASWPALNVRCAACWFLGQSFRTVNADFVPQGSQLSLRNGVIDTGEGRLDVQGDWKQGGQTANNTGLRGTLSGKDFDRATAFLGISTPLKGAPFNVDFDLHWKDVPWKPDAKTLNGTMKTRFGKGEIVDMGGGRAGQLLRLVSFDALLRKLQLDFRDTFGDGFYFDSIKSTAWIKDGVIHTNDLLVDGLAADIAINGNINLVSQRLDLEAVIAPEISATVGVATAFVINPIVGAAVFAASKALAPLWNKISLIRYQIDGTIAQPTVHEILRQSKEDKQANKVPAS
ncbi:AsmA2 domain-containing protein YhdP [Rouxiella chamberiensis]|uniref:AsmA2 domain-containing protein YhdP n=1 Tax=Rouxiella chamberiensis TaxID=1513468 RepID=A0ABY7HLS6_9GAMM|nr:AsmA2 domain-containing protein YhdP [Rouxiella chamberiensis]WAT00320.1 AsmA2 domain-containing protein YhdP [Rouxiella chamberiensis]